MVELIPGTSLPIQGSFGSPQPEGRGGIEITPDRAPVSRIDPSTQVDPDSLTPGERAILGTLLRRFDRRPRQLKTIFSNAAAQTDAITGNLVIPLFQCPQGCEGHVALVVADATQSAITANAGFANTASWAFLSAAQESTGLGNAAAASLRPGLFAFAPNPAALAAGAQAVLPFEWTFNDSNAPVLQSGDTLWYVLVGGSQASLQNIFVNVTYRINLFGFESGQL